MKIPEVKLCNVTIYLQCLFLFLFSCQSWGIEYCKGPNILDRINQLFHDDFNVQLHVLIFASQGLRFGSPFSPPLADLEYILKFARNATWWLIEVAPLR